MEAITVFTCIKKVYTITTVSGWTPLVSPIQWQAHRLPLVAYFRQHSPPLPLSACFFTKNLLVTMANISSLRAENGFWRHFDKYLDRAIRKSFLERPRLHLTRPVHDVDPFSATSSVWVDLESSSSDIDLTNLLICSVGLLWYFAKATYSYIVFGFNETSELLQSLSELLWKRSIVVHSVPPEDGDNRKRVWDKRRKREETELLPAAETASCSWVISEQPCVLLWSLRSVISCCIHLHSDIWVSLL